LSLSSAAFGASALEVSRLKVIPSPHFSPGSGGFDPSFVFYTRFCQLGKIQNMENQCPRVLGGFCISSSLSVPMFHFFYAEVVLPFPLAGLSLSFYMIYLDEILLQYVPILYNDNPFLARVFWLALLSRFSSPSVLRSSAFLFVFCPFSGPLTKVLLEHRTCVFAFFSLFSSPPDPHPHDYQKFPGLDAGSENLSILRNNVAPIRLSTRPCLKGRHTQFPCPTKAGLIKAFRAVLLSRLRSCPALDPFRWLAINASLRSFHFAPSSRAASGRHGSLPPLPC